MLNLRFGVSFVALGALTACSASDDASTFLSVAAGSGGSTAATPSNGTASNAYGGAARDTPQPARAQGGDGTSSLAQLGSAPLTADEVNNHHAAGGGTHLSTAEGSITSVSGSRGSSAPSTATVSNACAQVSGESKSYTAPPIIEFVLDNSDSMGDDSQPSTKGATKWQALRDAFNKAIPTLAAHYPDYAVGLTYFHHRDSGGLPRCTDAVQAVQIAPLTGTQADALVKSVQVQGYFGLTPTQDIWQFGADHALGWNGAAGYEASKRYVVVLTDGVPTVAANCGTAEGCRSTTGGWGSYGSNIGMGITAAQYQNFTDSVGRYQASKNVTTFMVAIPGAEALNQVTCDDGNVLYEPISKMSEVAEAGGTDLIDLTTSATSDFTAGLVDAITQRIGAQVVTVLSCRYAVPEPPTDAKGNAQFIDPNQVAVWYYESGGAICSSDDDCWSRHCSPSTSVNPNMCYTLIPRSPGCANPNGWDYADPANTTIELCSSGCAEAQADSNAKIEIQIGCFEVG